MVLRVDYNKVYRIKHNGFIFKEYEFIIIVIIVLTLKRRY